MKEKGKPQCPHCHNHQGKHFGDKIDEISEILFAFILPLSLLRKIIFAIGDKTVAIILKTAIQLKIIIPEKIFDRKKISNRSLVIIDEAKKKNINIFPIIKTSGRYSHFFYCQINNKQIVYDILPTRTETRLIDFALIDDKYRLKKLLKKHQLPHAEGDLFSTEKSGYQYGLNLGFPLVVKPRSGSLSNHVSANINNPEELRQAIKIVKQFKNFYLVERHVAGKVFRITVINDKIFAAKRIPAAVIGDGKHTITELVDLKNRHPFRGEKEEKDTTLHKIIINEKILEKLRTNNLSLGSVLPLGQNFILQEKVNLGSGCDIEDVTSIVHEENKKIFFELNKILRTEILGIDFICENIAEPYYCQPSAIIEGNSLPYIDMHHFPSIGTARNPAEEIIKLLLKNN